MAGKTKRMYVCGSCGSESPKWYGRCPDCGEWNTMEEVVRSAEPVKKQALPAPSAGTSDAVVLTVSEIEYDEDQRYKTGYSELDRVLGSGIVKGSVVLLSGDPGIGKSTILLQICQTLTEGLRVLYVSGEESARQIKLRATRLQVTSQNLYIASCTDMGTVVELIQRVSPQLIIIDSIQTMFLSTIASSAGSVSQVRECTQVLMHIAKSQEIPVLIVGHVNKDGAIAGPKVLEHIVDTVLYFEGERQLSYRILRAVKNRFGSTNEIGVFEMTEGGLVEVPNPSMALLSGRPEGVSGTCIACVMEGSRPILTEVQALVSKTAFGTPRRTSTGFDYNRTALLIAVLEKRCGYLYANLDTYINVVGGLRLDEPAADLPVALALVSNLVDKPIDHRIAAFGEIGLTGEIRAVSHMQSRVNECYRLGFTKCIVPYQSLSQLHISSMEGLEVVGVRNLGEAIRAFRE